MDKKSFFQERVLSRLFGESEPDTSKQQEEQSADRLVTDTDDVTDSLRRKVYTVSPAPKDWNEKTSVSEQSVNDPWVENQSSAEESGSDDSQAIHRRRKRRGKRFKPDHIESQLRSCEASERQNPQVRNDSVGEESQPKLTKNQKRKLKKKKRNEREKESVKNSISKEFVYCGDKQDCA